MHPGSSDSRLECIGRFEVPVFSSRCGNGELNRVLRDIVLSKRRSSDSEHSSNQGGGWHSRRDLHRWEEPAIAAFLKHLDEMLCDVVRATTEDPEPELLEGWLISAWANVNRKGALNQSHAHFWGRRRALWSGVYYVDPGCSLAGEDVAGETIFEDRVLVPRPLRDGNDPFSAELVIVPQPGMMLMFPASLRHRVEPYRGDGERITLAWNLYHPGFAVPLYDDESRLAGITLPHGWSGLGKVLTGILPWARERIFCAHPPSAVDRARPLEEVLAGSLAGPLRGSDAGATIDPAA